MAGAVRTLASQPARAAGAGERGESTEGGHNGGGTWDIGEDICVVANEKRFEQGIVKPVSTPPNK